MAMWVNYVRKKEMKKMSRKSRRKHREKYRARMESLRNNVEIEGGKPCPKCGKDMQRVEHGDGWKPKMGQPYCFRYWDKCASCRHIQHYEAAKVPLIEEDVDAPRDELTEQFKAVIG